MMMMMMMTDVGQMDQRMKFDRSQCLLQMGQLNEKTMKKDRWKQICQKKIQMMLKLFSVFSY